MVSELQSHLTTGQVARRCGVSDTLVRIWVRQGKLSAIQTPLGMLFERLAVEQLACDREQQQQTRVAVPA